MNPYDINPMALRALQEDEMKPAVNKESIPLAMEEISWSEQDVLQSYMPFSNNPDPIVRNKGLKIYKEMLVDEQVKVCSEIRKQARLSSEWTIKPGIEGNARSEEMADFVADMFNRMKGTFEDVLYQIYSAVDYGFSISEKVFDVVEHGKWKGKIGLKFMKTREPFNYDFKVDAHGNLEGLVYTGIGGPEKGIEKDQMSRFVPNYLKPNNNTLAALMPGSNSIYGNNFGTVSNPFPPQKFVIYSYNIQFGNLYGRSDLMGAFKWWLMKKHGSKFWAIWLERYASPFIWAQYKRDAGLKKSALEGIDDFIRNLSARQGVRVSDAVELKSIEFNSTGHQSYENSIEAYNRFITRSMLIPNLMGFTKQPESGSYALGQKHFDIFLWMLDKLGRDTSETIVGEQMIKPLVDLNFPDVDQEEYPKFQFLSVDDQSIDARSKIVSILASAGVIDVNEQWVREFLTIPKKENVLVNPDGTKIVASGEEEEEEEEETIKKEENPSGAQDPEKSKDKNQEDDKPKEKDAPKKEFQERAQTFFEKKIRVKEFKKKIESVNKAIFDEASKEIGEIRDDIVEQVKRKKIVINGDANDINRVAFNANGLKDIFLKWSVKIFLDSRLKFADELAEGGVRIEITRKFVDATDPLMEPWEPVPPQEAIDFFRRKVIAKMVNAAGKKIILDMASGIDLPFMRQRAFTIAGVIKDDILNDAKQIILNGIKKIDENQTIKDLKQMFNKYIEQGEMVDDELLRPYRLQTIVRTNITEAINQGRASMMMDPDVEGFVQYWQYSAILDDRTTEYCRCMDEKVFRLEDILMLNPPAHYNCRSISVPITKFEIDELVSDGKGVEVASPCAERPSGFQVKNELLNIQPSPEPRKDIPKVSEKPKKPDSQDAPAAPKSRQDVEANERLKEELRPLIARCPYPLCGSDDLSFVRAIYNVGEYQCNGCGLPFRVSNKGDVYLFDAGTEKWERVSVGYVPAYFSNKVK